MNTPADIRLVLSLAASPGSSGYRMHNAAYKALGLDYLYLPRRYEGDIAPALQAVRALGIRGVSLTMPYKVSAIPHLDALSPEAQAIGAVNTVVNEEGRLIGYNTDAPAAKTLIEQHMPWKNYPLVILGSGGMAHAFAHAARALGMKGFIMSRDRNKAETLAARFHLQVLGWEQQDALAGTIVCNATPLGMALQPESPVAAVKGLGGVFDAVASPAHTQLVKKAQECRIPVVSGDMLSLEQACLQFALYTGAQTPREVMKSALYGA